MADTPWYDLPELAAVPRLIEMRNELREKNLYDTEDAPLTGNLPPAGPKAPERGQRTVDGTYNDLNYPRMGCCGARFGRNVPIADTAPDLGHIMTPNPRTVSRELMTRDEFQPVPFLNLLAASWIQFQTHDWFSHGRDDSESNPHFEVPLASDDPWPAHPMRVPYTPADPTRAAGSTNPPTYVNHVTHWWDASQLYGSDAATLAKIRSGADGKVRVNPDLKLPLDPDTGLDLTGFIDNWWVGLGMLHGLFAAEHNAICDALKRDNRSWTDDKIFAKARLINAALLAKIHTVEWTPSILPHPTIHKAMFTNWYGALGELADHVKRVFGHQHQSELIGGIVGSPQEHHAAPYSLTEEFVSVYRMHTLMPDDFTFRSASSDAVLSEFEMPAIVGRGGRTAFDSMSMTDMFYSFGAMHPGMIRLHNFPRHLQNLKRDDGNIFDMAVVDILRDRERGVPRYNKFREFFHKDPVKSFSEITDNPEWQEQIARVYNNDLSMVDTQVGLLCEPLPEGFGFSETAFRVFVLMASRRLKSDRFFTDAYTNDVYTDLGIDWIDNNGMASVLVRHMPELKAALDGVDSPFRPWSRTGQRIAVAGAQG